ncbi:carboxypeptidase regulatory-like domain-containing protein [Flavobacterium sinopsychrotolerans]|uniref:Component of the Tol biopolymer transport system n=1 Tax=Flavobacterium sinopsychrotolerans TaxID=604089 RepID=A0A1H8RHR9_9FLAO|nr:carboxypeptidase regulatory-like domain-containing protein [Flavobacterium sinopsychrotolerans]SEO65797.1 component of the Tol biopolymer transport system [Flavobacterium sinopsychrotolerans]
MKKIGIKIVLCFILLVSCTEEQIDDSGIGMVKGRVVNSETFEPIENARISTSPTTNTFFTDKDGYFVFDEVLVGKYSFQAQKEGYITKFEPATVVKNTTIQIIFELDVSTANNKPPEIPLLTAPVDNAKSQSLKLNLTWTATDKESDPLTYTVTLKNGTTDVITTYKDIKTTTFEISGLSYSTKYYWQVSSSDGINSPSNSVTNTFTTLAFPNPRFLYIKKVNSNNVIYTADEAGNELQLSSSEVNSFRPRKNLQINKIAYISSDGSQNQIYTMDPDGSNVFKVTNSIPIAGFNMEHINYCWSTNGSQLIYPNFDKLYRIDANGGGLIELFKTPYGKFISECDWSQDGTQIVLKVNDLSGYNAEIYVIDNAGAVLYEVLSGLNGAVSGLNISVDNQKIVYTRDISGYQSSNYRRLDSRIFIYNRITNTSTELDTKKPDGYNDLDVKFSPNEADVIFTNTSNDGISIKNIQKASISDVDSRTTLFTGGSMPEWK